MTYNFSTFGIVFFGPPYMLWSITVLLPIQYSSDWLVLQLSVTANTILLGLISITVECYCQYNTPRKLLRYVSERRNRKRLTVEDDIHFVCFLMWDGFFSPPVSKSLSRKRVVRNPSHMEYHTKCIFSHTLHFKAL